MHGRYVQFHFFKFTQTKKTKIWYVHNGIHRLGEIKFFPQWRKYAFYPSTMVILEEDCLRDIAEFCEIETKKYKTDSNE